MAKRRGNNEGSIQQRSDGRWMARVSLPDGKRKGVYGNNRKEVEKKLRDMLNDLEKGIVPADGRQTVEQFLTYWLSSVEHEIEPSTFRGYGFHVRRFIKEFGKVPLARLTPQQVQGFYARLLSSGLAPTTTNRTHAIVKEAFKIDNGKKKNGASSAMLGIPPMIWCFRTHSGVPRSRRTSSGSSFLGC